MDYFFQFLKENKEILVSSLCLLLTLICIIVKRKPKTLDEFLAAIDSVLVKVPGYVWLVEHPGDGVLKKSEVIDYCRKDLVKILQRDLTEQETLYFIKNVSDSIEKVLLAPQKKEVL